MTSSFRISLLALLSFCIGWAISPAGYASELSFLQRSLGDFPDDLKAARKQGKVGVFLFFENKDCPFCHRMKTTVFIQTPVQEYFKKHFLVFSVDTVQTDEITDFKGKKMPQKAFFEEISRKRNATPVMAFFDLEGNQTTLYTGATDQEEFMLLGEYIVSGEYKKMPFTRYKRAKKKS